MSLPNFMSTHIFEILNSAVNSKSRSYLNHFVSSVRTFAKRIIIKFCVKFQILVWSFKILSLSHTMSKMSHSSSLKSHKLLFSTEKAGSSSFTEKSGLSKVVLYFVVVKWVYQFFFNYSGRKC